MTILAVDRLGEVGARVMMVAAADYVRANVPNVSDDCLDRIVAELRAVAVSAIAEALTDAKAAFEANMPHVAESTFKASLAVAAIRAAKAACAV